MYPYKVTISWLPSQNATVLASETGQIFRVRGRSHLWGDLMDGIIPGIEWACTCLFSFSPLPLVPLLLPLHCAGRKNPVPLFERFPDHRHRSLKAFEEHTQEHVASLFHYGAIFVGTFLGLGLGRLGLFTITTTTTTTTTTTNIHANSNNDNSNNDDLTKSDNNDNDYDNDISWSCRPSPPRGGPAHYCLY